MRVYHGGVRSGPVLALCTLYSFKLVILRRRRPRERTGRSRKLLVKVHETGRELLPVLHTGNHALLSYCVCTIPIMHPTRRCASHTSLSTSCLWHGRVHLCPRSRQRYSSRALVVESLPEEVLMAVPSVGACGQILEAGPASGGERGRGRRVPKRVPPGPSLVDLSHLPLDVALVEPAEERGRRCQMACSPPSVFGASECGQGKSAREERGWFGGGCELPRRFKDGEEEEVLDGWADVCRLTTYRAKGDMRGKGG